MFLIHGRTQCEVYNVNFTSSHSEWFIETSSENFKAKRLKKARESLVEVNSKKFLLRTIYTPILYGRNL